MSAETTPESFTVLLARARAGETDALEAILGATEGRLRSNVDRRLGPKLRAALRHSDVLQNAYLAMLDALPTFRGQSADEFVAWVTRIVENDIHRQNRWFGAARRRPPSRSSERNALARILLDPPPTPSAEAVRLEQRSGLRQALRRLEPDHALIIELALLQELPFRTIAGRLQRSEGACRMLLMRARAALAIELDAAEPGAE